MGEHCTSNSWRDKAVVYSLAVSCIKNSAIVKLSGVLTCNDLGVLVSSQQDCLCCACGLSSWQQLVI